MDRKLIIGLNMYASGQLPELIDADTKDLTYARKKLRKGFSKDECVTLSGRAAAKRVPEAVITDKFGYVFPLEGGGSIEIPPSNTTFYSPVAVEKLRNAVAERRLAPRDDITKVTMAVPELTVTGSYSVEGRNYPVVLGGFGYGARCVTDLAVAQMHDIEPRFIRRLIRHNQARFEKSVDIIELSRCAPEAHLENTLLQLGYTQSMLEQEGLVYILSERGYFKLVKIMNNDRAWDVYNELLRQYFVMREAVRPQRTSRELPSDFAAALRMLADEVERTSALEEQIRRDQPKVAFSDAVADSRGTMALGEYAKSISSPQFSIGRNTLFKWLKEKKILQQNNIPYQKYLDKGYFVVTEYLKNGMWPVAQPRITGKGQAFVYNKLMKEFGIH